jgi:hypothetical protein
MAQATLRSLPQQEIDTQRTTMTDYRREKDSMGDRDLPTTAYYGIQTLRAIDIQRQQIWVWANKELPLIYTGSFPSLPLTISQDSKQPTFTVCQLNGEEYSQQQYRLGQTITSTLLPNLQLCLDEILPR